LLRASKQYRCLRVAKHLLEQHSKSPLLRVGGAPGPVLFKSNNHQGKVGRNASHCSGSIVSGRVIVRVIVVLKRNKVSFPLKNNKNPNNHPARNYAPTTVGSTFSQFVLVLVGLYWSQTQQQPRLRRALRVFCPMPTAAASPRHPLAFAHQMY